MNTIVLCNHCGGNIALRNPMGYCDHLYYPDNCEECKKMKEEEKKNFVASGNGGSAKIPSCINFCTKHEYSHSGEESVPCPKCTEEEKNHIPDTTKKVQKEQEIKTCEHCGAKLRQYKVPLTQGVVRALIKFRATVYAKQRNEIHLLDDMRGTSNELTPHEWNNFSRLRFHGMVAKYKENGLHKSGYWLITKRGADFLNGRETVPQSVTVFRNKVVDHAMDEVSIGDVMRDETVPYFEHREDIIYEHADAQV